MSHVKLENVNFSPVNNKRKISYDENMINEQKKSVFIENESNQIVQMNYDSTDINGLTSNSHQPIQKPTSLLQSMVNLPVISEKSSSFNEESIKSSKMEKMDNKKKVFRPY